MIARLVHLFRAPKPDQQYQVPTTNTLITSNEVYQVIINNYFDIAVDFEWSSEEVWYRGRFPYSTHPPTPGLCHLPTDCRVLQS